MFLLKLQLLFIGNASLKSDATHWIFLVLQKTEVYLEFSKIIDNLATFDTYKHLLSHGRKATLFLANKHAQEQ